MSGPSPEFEKLIATAAIKKLRVVLPLHGRGERSALRIEVRNGDKIVEYETVKKNEKIDAAARRLLLRLRKDKILD